MSQIALANLMVQSSFKDELDLNTFRFMILQTIKKNLKKHKDEFGKNVVIACDAGNSWRKDYFSYYKANRIKDREENQVLDWKLIFEYLDIVKKELKEYFPYKVVQVSRCEGDDIIGTLCAAALEKTLIVSTDKDFQQLQKFMHVKQWDPIKDKWIECKNPKEFLIDHIIKGDKSDGVPNILSPDDQLVMKTRAVTLSSKRMIDLKEKFANADVINILYYHRNKKVIDLSELPETYKDEILLQYDSEANKSRSKILNYFIKNRLTKLVEALGDF